MLRDGTGCPNECGEQLQSGVTAIPDDNLGLRNLWIVQQTVWLIGRLLGTRSF